MESPHCSRLATAFARKGFLLVSTRCIARESDQKKAPRRPAEPGSAVAAAWTLSNDYFEACAMRATGRDRTDRGRFRPSRSRRRRCCLRVCVIALRACFELDSSRCWPARLSLRSPRRSWALKTLGSSSHRAYASLARADDAATQPGRPACNPARADARPPRAALLYRSPVPSKAYGSLARSDATGRTSRRRSMAGRRRRSARRRRTRRRTSGSSTTRASTSMRRRAITRSCSRTPTRARIARLSGTTFASL